MTEKAVIDAQVLFYFHYEYQKIPLILQQLKKKVINGEITIILPTFSTVIPADFFAQRK